MVRETVSEESRFTLFLFNLAFSFLWSLTYKIINFSLAFAEMRLVLAKIIFNFDLKLADDSYNWIERQKNYNVWDRIPLNVSLTPVEKI